MNKFSSFKDQQLLVENWRDYNKKEKTVINEEAQNLEEIQAPGLNLIVSILRSLGKVAYILEDVSVKFNIKELKSIADSAKQFHEAFDKFEKEYPSLLKLMIVADIFGAAKGKIVEFGIDQVKKAIEKDRQFAISSKTQSEDEPTEEVPKPQVTESIYHGAHLDDGTLVCEACLQELLESQRTIIQEAKYQGRTVTLNKPTKGDVKKFKVYVKDPSTGNVKKVNFGDPNMKIKKNIPARRKSFRARHNCDNPGPKTKARYWSCKKW